MSTEIQVALNYFLDTLVENGVCELVDPKWGNYQFADIEVDHNSLRSWMQESITGAAKWAAEYGPSRSAVDAKGAS